LFYTMHNTIVDFCFCKLLMLHCTLVCCALLWLLYFAFQRYKMELRKEFCLYLKIYTYNSIVSYLLILILVCNEDSRVWLYTWYLRSSFIWGSVRSLIFHYFLIEYNYIIASNILSKFQQSTMMNSNQVCVR
jgi:hypothetical protein